MKKGLHVRQIGKPSRHFWVTNPQRIIFWRKMAEIQTARGVTFTEILHDRTEALK